MPADPNGSGSTISNMTLTIFGHNYGTSGTVGVHKITQNNWLSSQVTWNEYSTGNAWLSAGGDYGSTLATSTVGTGNVTISFDVTSSGYSWGATKADFIFVEDTATLDSVYGLGNGYATSTLVITYSAGGGTSTPSSTLDSMGLWGNIASTTLTAISSSGNLFEVGLALFFSFLALFLVIVIASKYIKKLLH